MEEIRTPNLLPLSLFVPNILFPTPLSRVPGPMFQELVSVSEGERNTKPLAPTLGL